MDEENEAFRLLREYLVICEEYFPDLKGIVSRFDQRGIYVFDQSHRLQKRHYTDEVLAMLAEDGREESGDLIRTLIAEHIVGCSLNKQNNLYNEFVESRIGPEADPVIICMNFDCLLEKTMLRRSDLHFDYKRTFDYSDSTLSRIAQDKNQVPLLKLHGSLNWIHCRQCGKVRQVFPPSNRLYLRSMSCSGCKDDTVLPLTCIPHEGLPAGFSTIWDYAEEALSNCRNLTVVGYSFPEYDTRVRDLFDAHLPHSAEITLVDQGSESALHRKFSRVFPGRSISIHAEGFESFLRGD